MQIFKNPNFNIVNAQKNVFMTSAIIVVLAVIMIAIFGIKKELILLVVFKLFLHLIKILISLKSGTHSYCQ